ncbi:MAG TPA: urea ABC transporter permease subunit UrtC [Chthoniobacterales bacterium]|jgi:urea transport system permease protein
MKSEVSKIEILIAALFAAVLIFIVPALNAFTPDGSALHVSNFNINLWGQYLCLAIVAMSIDLLWGYTGLLSLGQMLFFALGGYALGMHLMLMIGKLGQYKSDLPDFMVFLGYNKLPIHWEPFYNVWFAIGAVFWVPGLVALIFGYLAFRSRIKGVYFSILTQALTYAACLLFFRNELTLGGNNGFTDFKTLFGAQLGSVETQRALYIASAVALVVVYAFCRWLTLTKFGKVQRAIRDSENRVLFSGYAAANFKLFVFVVAGMIAGVAGALYVPQVGIINPSQMEPAKSLEAVVWVAVGGRATLLGPVVGAIVVNALKSWASQAYPAYWPIFLGGMFVIVVLFMPKGIVGIPGQVMDIWRRYKNSREPDAPAPTNTPVEETK